MMLGTLFGPFILFTSGTLICPEPFSESSCTENTWRTIRAAQYIVNISMRYKHIAKD